MDRKADCSYRHSDTDDEETDPYATDEDSEYNPESEEHSRPIEESEEENVDELFEHELNSENERNIPPHVIPKRARKRKINTTEWTKAKRKNLRTKGATYITAKGKIVRARKLKRYDHTCRYNCKNITEKERENVFKKFYELKTYDLQTSFIASCITKDVPARKKQGTVNGKSFVTKISLLKFRVCKEFFLKTLDITNRRFTTVCKKITPERIAECDKRGKHPPGNKIPEERKDEVIAHIKLFPKYKSHYSRAQNENSKYLSPELNIALMYKLYCEWCKELGIISVKESYYRNIFCTHFNLKFHRPHSDTCHTCDKLNNLIKSGPDESVRKSKIDLELHQRKVQNVVTGKNSDIAYSKENQNCRVVCFDLQKTLPTPLLTTNKVYYLRQLWTYNLCIYELTSKKSYMYIWNETVASRGSLEIASCLVKFINDLPENVTHLICYSDSCGGQNKNKNITKLFMYLVQCTKLKTIDHKFFLPGHSYMECDRSFGLIEMRKKKIPIILIPQHWTNIIKATSKNFVVYEMKPQDFISFSKLNEIMKDPKFTNREVNKDDYISRESSGSQSSKKISRKKKSVQKKQFEPLKWRDIVWFRYESDHHFTFDLKYSHTADVLFSTSEKCILTPGRPIININVLSNNELKELPKISLEKWRNLISLLPYISPIHHDFYMNIRHEEEEKKRKSKKGKRDTSVNQTEQTENVNESVAEEDENANENVPEELYYYSDIFESDYDE